MDERQVPPTMGHKSLCKLPLVLWLAFCMLAVPSISRTRFWWAQNDAPPSIIKVNVLVLDRSNHSIRTLPQSAFRLFEDGKNQPISFFSDEELPLKYCVLVDNTGSIRSRINEIRDAARIAIGNHKPDDSAFIVSMSDGGATLSIGWSSDKKALIDTIDSLKPPSGSTRLLDAMYKCSELIAEAKPAPNRRALILISDGLDNGSSHKLDKLLRRLDQDDVQVYVVGLVPPLDASGLFRISSRERSMDLLERISEETGGRVFFPKSSEELRLYANHVLDYIRSEIVLGYVPTIPLEKDSYRKISVKVEAPGADKYRVISRRHVGFDKKN
jgi:Ca-activated chloride channel homolog